MFQTSMDRYGIVMKYKALKLRLYSIVPCFVRLIWFPTIVAHTLKNTKYSPFAFTEPYKLCKWWAMSCRLYNL